MKPGKSFDERMQEILRARGPKSGFIHKSLDMEWTAMNDRERASMWRMLWANVTLVLCGVFFGSLISFAAAFVGGVMGHAVSVLVQAVANNVMGENVRLAQAFRDGKLEG